MRVRPYFLGNPGIAGSVDPDTAEGCRSSQQASWGGAPSSASVGAPAGDTAVQRVHRSSRRLPLHRPPHSLKQRQRACAKQHILLCARPQNTR